MKQAGIFIILLILGLVSLNVNGQKTSILLLDKKTGDPVPYAHILAKSMNDGSKEFVLSNGKGKAEVNLQSTFTVTILYIGYEKLVDTLSPGKAHQLYLYPASFDVDEVVITGQLEPQRVDQSIYKIKVIGSQEIQRRAANTMNDILSTELKFRTFNDGVLGSSMSIQGLSGNNVKVLIDGVPVIGREGGNIDLNQLNLSNIDHVEIVEGPLSVIYGSNSLAGAINLITKENQLYKYKTTLNSYYESVGVYNADALVTARHGNGSYTLSGGRYFTQEFDINPEIRSTLWKPKEQYFADLGYVYNKNRSKFKIQSSFLRELLIDKGTPRLPYGEEVLDTWLTSYRGSITGNYEHRIEMDKLASLMVSYSSYYRYNDKYLKDLTNLENRLTSTDLTIADALLARGTWKNFGEGKKFNYQFGFDINRESGEGDKIDGGRKVIGDYAMFWSAQFKANKKLNFQPGLRYGYNSEFSSPLVPSLNIKWSPYKLFDLRASYVRGFRAPTLKELYMYFYDTNHNIQGNPDLKSEHGHNFNLAININTNQLHKKHYSNIKIDLYYNRMKNNIELAVVDPDLLYYTYVNIANFTTLGGFAQFDYRFHPYLRFSAGVGRSGFANSIDEESVKTDQILYGTDVSSELTLTSTRYNSDLSLFYKYNGKLPRFDFDENGNLVYNYMGSYHNMDVSINKRMLQNRLRFTVGVKNLFDNYTVDSFGVGGGPHSGGTSSPVAWGRTWFVKLTYNVFKATS